MVIDKTLVAMLLFLLRRGVARGVVLMSSGAEVGAPQSGLSQQKGINIVVYSVCARITNLDTRSDLFCL